MKTLERRIALVAGGTGELGEGIVRALLREGATVIVPSRDPDRLETLRRAIGEAESRLVTMQGELGNTAGAETLRERIITDHGALDIVVASLGGLWRGRPLVHTDAPEWEGAIGSNLTTHYITARTFLPMLLDRAGSSYTMIIGAAALGPLVGRGILSITAAAQVMMKEVLAAESAGSPTRVNAVIVAAPVRTRTRSTPSSGWLSVDEVGEYVAWLAGDDASHMRDQTIRLQSREQLPI